ncbi:unnamed protein product [Merluccius merluccius]
MYVCMCVCVCVCLLVCSVAGGGVWCDCSKEGMEMEGGHYTLSNGLSPGSLLVYQCPPDYYPYPSLTRECLSNMWKDPPRHERVRAHQQCRLVECPDPHVLQYGTVYPPEVKYFVNNETTYECDSGYRLRGSERRVCLENGKWSGSTPICSRDDVNNHCPDPGIPPGSSRSGNIFDIDDEVIYRCNDANVMYMVGSKVRTCKEGGEWTGTEPACFYKYTYDTAQDISQDFGDGMQLSLTMMKSVDDIQGERMIRISKNGILNIYIAVDISDSLKPEDIKKSKTMVHNLISRIASYSVSPNYDIVFFTSAIEHIANIVDYYTGQVHQTLEILLENLDKFEIKTNRAGTNLNAVFAHILQQIALIKANSKDNFDEQHHVILTFTDGGYNMGGSPVNNLERIKAAIPKKDHLDVYVFAVGAKIYENYLMPLVTEDRGRHFFRINKETMESMFDEIFDDGEVVSLCGLHKTADSRGTKQKMYPWNVEINIKLQKCFGSIVSPKYVLTAAHCLIGAVSPDITVDIMNRNYALEMERFYSHSEYNYKAKRDQGISEFHDYDIALLELTTAVNFSVDVRPICIPCTKETTQAIRMPLHSKCSEQGYNTRMTPRDLTTRRPCIMEATKLPNITAENVHTVVTDNFLCTGGISPSVDHIACKGDSGGAVFKDTNQRTIQIGVVSWGTELLCETGSLEKSTKTSRDFHLNLFKVMEFLHDVMATETKTVAATEFIDNWNS